MSGLRSRLSIESYFVTARLIHASRDQLIRVLLGTSHLALEQAEARGGREAACGGVPYGILQGRVRRKYERAGPGGDVRATGSRAAAPHRRRDRRSGCADAARAEGRARVVRLDVEVRPGRDTGECAEARDRERVVASTVRIG